MGGQVLILEQHPALQLHFPLPKDFTNFITLTGNIRSSNPYIWHAGNISPVSLGNSVDSQDHSAIAENCDFGSALGVNKEVYMDFIEQWLHISPDGGNGTSEFLSVTAVVTIVVGIGIVALRGHLPKNLIEFLEQFGRRESSDRFDN